MRILIVGAQRVGRRLASDLLQDGHDVRVLDVSPTRLAALPDTLQKRALHGSALERDVLERALAGCDAVATTSDDDAFNVVVALAGRRELQVPLAVAIVGSPARARALSGLGAHIICPTAHTARELHLTLVRSGIETEILLGGDAGIFRAEIPPRLVGRSVREIERPGQLLAVAVERDHRTLLAVPELVLAQGDVLHAAAVDRDHISSLVRP